MIESIIITLLPVLFLIVLFGGGALLRRQNVDMDGDMPIDRRWFYLSKSSITIVWAGMVAQGWGVNLSLIPHSRLIITIALLLWIAGFSLLLAGRMGMGNSFRIGSAKESTRLKTAGLFRFSRNPMYLGIYTTLTASVLFTLNPILFLLAIFIISVHHKIVLAEENHLKSVFGQEYTDYCGRVRRYL